jgi:hypothetical protein
MMTLSNKDNDVLFERGIRAYTDNYLDNIALSTTGIAWLLNFLYTTNKTDADLSLNLLKELARFQASKGTLRELRFKAVPIPVYDGTHHDYYQLIFYLNGTPPKVFLAFDLMSGIDSTFMAPSILGGSFKVKNDKILHLKFTDNEVEQLEAGQLVVNDSLIATTPPTPPKKSCIINFRHRV